MGIQALGHLCVWCVCTYIHAQCLVVAAFYTNRYCGRATVSLTLLLWFCFVFCVFVLFCYSKPSWKVVSSSLLWFVLFWDRLVALPPSAGTEGCSTSHSSHCGFHLHCLANQQCRESSCASWSYLYVIVGEMPTFKMRLFCLWPPHVLCVSVR